MGYIIASLVAILLATLIVYKLANSIFGLDLRLKPLMLCALCAMFISLVLPKIVVGFAGLPGTLAVLAVFAVIFAYFVAKYEDDSSLQTEGAETEVAGEQTQQPDLIDLGLVTGVAGTLTGEAVGDTTSAEPQQAGGRQTDGQPVYDQTFLHTAENIEIFANEPELASAVNADNSQAGDRPDSKGSDSAEISAAPAAVPADTTAPQELSAENAGEEEEYIAPAVADEDTQQAALQAHIPEPVAVLAITAMQPAETREDIVVAELEAVVEEEIVAEESDKEVANEASSAAEYLQAAGEEQMPEPALPELSDPVEEVPAAAAAEEVTLAAASDNDNHEASSAAEYLQAADAEQMPEPALPELSDPVEEVAGVEATVAEEDYPQAGEPEIEPEFAESAVTQTEISYREAAAVPDAILQDHAPALPEPEKPDEIVTGPAGDGKFASTEEPPTDQIDGWTESSNLVEELSSTAIEPVAADSSAEVVQERLAGIPEQSFEQEAGSSTMRYNEPLPVSEDLDDLLDYAFVSKESQDYSAAFRAFNRALVLYPDSDAAPFLVVEIGNILKNKGSYDEAIKMLSDGRSLSHTRHDAMMEQEFISAIAYLRITKNVLLQNRLGNIPFTDIPPQIVQQIDEEFKEWRSVGSI